MVEEAVRSNQRPTGLHSVQLTAFYGRLFKVHYLESWWAYLATTFHSYIYFSLLGLLILGGQLL